MIIPYDLSSFKVLIKKLFPPKKCVFTVDTSGDGKADSIQIKVINLLVPFVVPENIEIGEIDLKNFDIDNFNLSNYVNLFLDDIKIEISKDSINLDNIKDQITIHHKGESFKLDEIIEGKFSGRTIALGDSISVLIKLDDENLILLSKGEHSFKIESDLISNLIINFELDKSNMNIKFDPKNT